MPQEVVIVDTGLGNIGSVYNMIKKVGGRPRLISDPASLKNCDKIILPGVGAFDNGISRLDKSGFHDAICEEAQRGSSILGICLGMQMLTSSSEEGVLPGLGLIPGECKKFDAKAYDIKVPHMGWNSVTHIGHPLFEGLDEARFYFVHSFYAEVDESNILATCTYGASFSCGIVKDNVIGLQFHPEKSHRFGMKLFSNYLAM